MSIKDATTWNRRLAAVYAVSVWTMIASYAFIKYTAGSEERPAASDNREELEVPDDKVKVTYETPHSHSVVIYKKDFVPLTTRVSNFLKSFGSQRGPGDE